MEEFDLNAIRSQAKKEVVPQTKEERIAELQQRITDLEQTPEPPTMFETFDALPTEEQQSEVDRIIKNRELNPGSYSIEDRKEELHSRLGEPSLRNIRIAAAKRQLEDLINAQEQ